MCRYWWHKMQQNCCIFTVVQQLWLTYTMTYYEASATFVNWYLHGVYNGETVTTGTLFLTLKFCFNSVGTWTVRTSFPWSTIKSGVWCALATRIMRTVPPPPDYKFTMLYYILTLFFECLSSYKRNYALFFSIKQYNRSLCKQFCALFTGVSGNITK